MKKNYELAEKILRYGLALTILWFGVSQLIKPDDWIGFLPEWAFAQTIVTTVALVYMNGLFETITSLMLLSNDYSKTVSILLAIHMLFIIFHLGYNDLAVRDFAIFAGFVSLAYMSDNTSCISRFKKNKKKK